MKKILFLMIVLILAACTPAASSEDDADPAGEPEMENTQTPVPLYTDTPQPTAAPDEPQTSGPVALVQANVAATLGIDASALKVVSVEEVVFNDSCLGVHMKDVMCLQVLTPGWIIVFDAPDGRYTFHANAAGSTYVLAGQE